MPLCNYNKIDITRYEHTHVTTCPGCCYNFPRTGVSCNMLTHLILCSLSSHPLFSKLKLLKLDDLYNHQLGIYMYTSTKGLFPDSMPSIVIPNHNVHDHNLRNKNEYYIQHVRTNCRNFTIHYTGPILWNTLPQQLREALSEKQFKRKLK